MYNYTNLITYTAYSIILTPLDTCGRKVVILNNKRLFCCRSYYYLRHKVKVIVVHAVACLLPAAALSWLACTTCLNYKHGYMICIYHMSRVLHKSAILKQGEASLPRGGLILFLVKSRIVGFHPNATLC